MKLHSIQYLRAVAAVLVVLSHAATSLLRRERVVIDLSFGAYGVDLFFVISGFIMVVSTAGRNTSPGEFLTRRAIRIVPLYFLVTTLLFALALWVLPDADVIHADVPAYLKSIFFIPHWNPKLHNLEPLLGQGWTLNYEALFYLLFGAALLAGRNLRLLIVLAGLSLVCAVGAPYRGSQPAILTYGNPLMLEFGLGVLLGTAYSRPRAPDLVASAWAITAGAVLIALGAAACFVLAPGGPVLRFAFVGLPAAALVFALVQVDGRGRLPRWNALEAVGDSSYSLYLTHTLVLGAGRRIWQRLFEIQSLGSHVAFIAVATPLCIAAGIAVYRLVERPLTEWLLRSRRKASPAT